MSDRLPLKLPARVLAILTIFLWVPTGPCLGDNTHTRGDDYSRTSTLIDRLPEPLRIDNAVRKDLTSLFMGYRGYCADLEVDQFGKLYIVMKDGACILYHDGIQKNFDAKLETPVSESLALLAQQRGPFRIQLGPDDRAPRPTLQTRDSVRNSVSLQPRWSFRTPGKAWLGQPVLDGDSLYFITSDDHLIALDSRTGRLRWQFDPGTGQRYSEEDMSADAGTFPSPAVSGNMVFFSSHDGSVYGVDAATGMKRWRFVTRAAWLSEPVASGGKVFFGTDAGDVYAVDALTGTGRWNVKMPGGEATIGPTAMGNRIVVSASVTGGLVTAFDQETGSRRWSWKQVVKEDDWLCHGMQVLDGGDRVFVGAGNCAQLAALYSRNGRLIWNASIPAQLEGGDVFLKAASHQTVIAQNDNGALSAYSGATGTMKWQFSPGNVQGLTRCAIDRETAYVLTNEGRLYALDEHSGARKLEATLRFPKPSTRDDDAFAPPHFLTVSKGEMYVAAPDGTLAAYAP